MDMLFPANAAVTEAVPAVVQRHRAFQEAVREG